jgi:1-deoxy-D-xylulose-5-phosphate synthase
VSVLKIVNSPADLKVLHPDQLPYLAKEIRQLIVETISNNGGHMASNLGAVELTIALHRVFESPKDKLLFDVSHQSYTHKILTGRAGKFAAIRTSRGYSGYFDPEESEHDVLALGHAGCAPSLALGLAMGETMKGGDGYMVCVIGDGSLTSGLAYEGLSNIVHYHPRNLMVILNDNGMAISPNVGWLAAWRGRWLPHLRGDLELDKDFQTFEAATENLAPKIPFGNLALDFGKGLKSAVQKVLIPEVGQVWDEMGFNYLGPVDGHNIEDLVAVLQKARQNSDKVPFIHVLTNKGQGWDPASRDPVRYHQPGPTTAVKKKRTYSQVFAAFLGDLMELDEKVVAISAAMLEGTGLAALQADFPQRVIDVGICEQHAVSLAAGLARAGFRPVVCIYSTFMQRAFDQIMHDVCMNDLHVVFAMDRAGIVGQDGKTHHGLYDLAYMRIAPNMVVAVPRDENELGHLLHTALNQDHPFSLRFPRGEAPGTPLDRDLRELPVGTAEIIIPSKGLCLVGVGEQVMTCIQARRQLETAGIYPGVVNLRYIKPVDQVLVEELSQDYEDVVVVEEGTSVGGAGAALLEALARHGHQMPRVHQLSAGDIFADHGEIAELRHQLGLDTNAIVALVRRIAEGGE